MYEYYTCEFMLVVVEVVRIQSTSNPVAWEVSDFAYYKSL